MSLQRYLSFRLAAHKTWALTTHCVAPQHLFLTHRSTFSSHKYADNESGHHSARRHINKSKQHYVLRNVQDRHDSMNKHTEQSMPDNDEDDEFADSAHSDPVKQRQLNPQYEQTESLEFDDCESTDEIMQRLWTSETMLNDIIYHRALTQCHHLGDFKGALRVFHDMNKHGITQTLDIYHVLLQCLCDCDRIELACKYVNMMRRNSIQPETETFQIILSRCKQRISNLQFAENLWKKMIFECNIAPNTDICNIMMGIYAKCGEVHKAETIWNHLVAHDLVDSQTCVEIINCYAIKKDERKLVELQQFMLSRDIPLEGEHYHGIIKYYLSIDRPNKVLKLFDEMDTKLVRITEPLLYQLCLTYLRLKKPDRVIRNLYERYPRLFEHNQELYGLYFEAHWMEYCASRTKDGLIADNKDNDRSGDTRDLLMTFRRALSENFLTGYWAKHIDEERPGIPMWWIDVHGVYRRKSMIRFVLRYIFQFEHKYVKEQLDLNQDIMVLCGRGAHSGIGVIGTTKTVAERELLSWDPPIRSTTHSKYAECLVLNKDDVERFFKRHRSGNPFFHYP